MKTKKVYKTVKCANSRCGKTFQQKKPWQSCCSPSCRVTHHNCQKKLKIEADMDQLNMIGVAFINATIELSNAAKSPGDISAIAKAIEKIEKIRSGVSIESGRIVIQGVLSL